MGATATKGTLSPLTRLSRLVYRRATEEAIGIRLKQLVALEFLRDQGCSTQQNLGQTLMLDANNCVILLNDLEEAGFAERRRDPEDRRRHLVTMTPAGARALERAEKKLDGLEEEVLGNLDSSERSELRRLLAKALDKAD